MRERNEIESFWWFGLGLGTRSPPHSCLMHCLHVSYSVRAGPLLVLLPEMYCPTRIYWNWVFEFVKKALALTLPIRTDHRYTLHVFVQNAQPHMPVG